MGVGGVFGFLFNFVMGLWEFAPLFLFIALFIGGVRYLNNRKKPKVLPPAQPQPQKQKKSLEEKAGLLSGKGILIGHKADYIAEGYYLKDGSGPWFWKTNTDRPLTYNGDRHLVTFGPTGSGKNTTSQTPVLLQYDASALIIDVKGQLGAITAITRMALGHKVAVLNPFDTLGIPSATYNPLSHIDPKSVTFVSDCRRIAEGLVDTPKSDHWELSALDVVALLVMWVKLYEEDKSLVRVRQLLNLPEAIRIKQFETMTECENPIIAEGAARYSSDSKEVQDCIQTAVVQLGFLRDPAIEKVLQGGPNEISFAELKRRKMTVFLIIPPDLLHTHGKFLRLLVLSALGELIREPTKPEDPVLFMLDEFAQLGHMSIIENAAAIVRDYQIRLWIILQNLPQLKALYGNKWESFLSSSGVIQGFGPNDLETSEYLSKRSGIKTIKSVSESISVSDNSGNSPSGTTSGSSSSHSANITDKEVPKYSVQKLFNFNNESQLLICAGMGEAIYAARIPYWKQAGFIGFMSDPYHMTTEKRFEFEQKTRTGKWIPEEGLRIMLKDAAWMRARVEVYYQIFPSIKELYNKFTEDNMKIEKAKDGRIIVFTPDGNKWDEFESDDAFLEDVRQEVLEAKMKHFEKTADDRLNEVMILNGLKEPPKDWSNVFPGPKRKK